MLTHAWLLGNSMLGKLGHDTSNLELLVALVLVSLYVAQRQLQSNER